MQTMRLFACAALIACACSNARTAEAPATCPGTWRFAEYSYTDLRVSGFTVEASRRVLLTNSANATESVPRGDCVGREQALVKDIGDGWVTFGVTRNGIEEEHSVQTLPSRF